MSQTDATEYRRRAHQRHSGHVLSDAWCQTCRELDAAELDVEPVTLTGDREPCERCADRRDYMERTGLDNLADVPVCDHQQERELAGDRETPEPDAPECVNCGNVITGAAQTCPEGGECEPATYDPETGDGGHCLDQDAEHWYKGNGECGHCSAAWVNGPSAGELADAALVKQAERIAALEPAASAAVRLLDALRRELTGADKMRAAEVADRLRVALKADR